MIYVTHDQSEAMTLADKIVVLRGGAIEQVGRPMDLYQDPANAFVAGFIGSPQMNFVPARILAAQEGRCSLQSDTLGGTRFDIELRNSNASPTPEVTLGFRPEYVKQSAESSSICGHVEVVERLGNVSYLYVRCDGGARVTIEERSASSARSGAALRFCIDPQHLLVFDSNGRRL